MCIRDRWYKDGELLDGETNSTLSVSESGSYTVKVSASDGQIASAEAESAASEVTITGHSYVCLLYTSYTAVAMLLMSCVPSSTFKVAPPLTKTKYPVELVLAILLPSIVTFVRVSFALLPSTEMS